jgi:hypothetical protein
MSNVCGHSGQDQEGRMSQQFDVQYWSQFYKPGETVRVDVTRWGNECQRGCAYKDVGTTVDGAANQRRSISSGRKARGYASGTDGKPK